VAIRAIRFQQSGGLTGLVSGCLMQASDLKDADLKALEHHVRSIIDHGAGPANPGSARDQIVYQIELETDSGPVRLEFDELSVPDGLALLVEALQSRSRPMPLR
jgi:hypothetical protein